MFVWVCKLFKKEKPYIPQPYVEKDTRCDLCKYKDECDAKICSTISLDTREHYIRGLGGECKAEKRGEQ